MGKYILITPQHNDSSNVIVGDGTTASPDDDIDILHNLVGGSIEQINCRHLPSPFVMFGDEEGKMMRLDVNDIATAILDWGGDYVCGNVIILAHEGPAAQWLSDHEVERIKGIIDDCLA